MPTATRRIGPIGTSTRLLIAAALLYLALFDWTTWGLTWYDGAIAAGLVAASVAAGLVARRYAHGPLRFTGPAATTLNCAAIIALVANRYTAGGAELFYGATLLVAAWRAQPGCEATVLSNLILRRDDQIGCPTFTPIDEAEARIQAARAETRTSLRSVLSVAGASLACCTTLFRSERPHARGASERR
jgi:hypothetical protein